VRATSRPDPGRISISPWIWNATGCGEGPRWGEKWGDVAMDPQTGSHSWRMASPRPTFDPTCFSKGPTTAEWERTQTDPKRPLLNRVLRGLPPASTFKVNHALAALGIGVASTPGLQILHLQVFLL